MIAGNKKYFFTFITKSITLTLILFFLALQVGSTLMAQDFEQLRNEMVEKQLKDRGIQSKTILEAMRSVPRHLFVPLAIQHYAYQDSPLPIGLEQTISQPYIVAYMTEQLKPVAGMKILEIGTGYGYLPT